MSSSLKEDISQISQTQIERVLRKLLAEQVCLQGSASFTPNLVDGAGSTHVVTVPGAAVGDFVLASLSVDAADVTVTGYVQAANTVEIRIQNESGAGFTPGAITGYVRVFPRNNIITA